MGKHAGMYKSTKRRKELSRQKKQEEKRLKRLNKGGTPEQQDEAQGAEIAEKTGGE